MRQCKVFVNDKEAGILQETDNRQYRFKYLDGYHGAPVCLAMPVRSEAYQSDNLFPYFFNMLSEGANRQTQSTLLHIDENDDFGIVCSSGTQILSCQRTSQYADCLTGLSY